MTEPAATSALDPDALGLGSWSTQHGDSRITSVLSEIDVDRVHGFLSEESSWARGIPRALLERAMGNSLCFGDFVDRCQVAFARVVTDRATFANLADVFVLPAYTREGCEYYEPHMAG